MKVRSAEQSEIGALTRLWYDGWQDAHANILPAELARLRTRESFEKRLETALADVLAIGPVGEPLGFCMLKGDELYQLYVSAQAPLPKCWSRTRRRGCPKTASGQLGLPVRLETREPRDSTRNAAGAAPVPSLSNWKPRTGRSHWRSGAMRNFLRTLVNRMIPGS
jgi:hypothetical protein